MTLERAYVYTSAMYIYIYVSVSIEIQIQIKFHIYICNYLHDIIKNNETTIFCIMSPIVFFEPILSLYFNKIHPSTSFDDILSTT
jgi:hypothetical protein